jgi:hypothetical protein
VANANFFATCEAAPCPSACENVFEMVHVSYLIRGGTRVMWTLREKFNDPQPWMFQLQAGRTANQDADDWTNVGLPMTNSCYMIDPEKRNYSKGGQDAHYRIKLVTPVATYYSEPTAKAGILNLRDWRLAHEIIRKERLRFRYATQDGYLLKRRITGNNCPRCLDLQTMEVKDPYCPQCWGTGKECGYYYPIGCVWADLSPLTRRRQLDNEGMRGTVRDIVITGRMLMLPLIEEKDVWISRKTDDRYYIESIQDVAEIRGVPLVANVELRPAPYTDVIYNIAIPQQDAWLQQHC